MIIGQLQFMTVSQLIGLEMQQLVVPLTYKETVSRMIMALNLTRNP